MAAMTPVLAEILATGKVMLPSGERVPVSSQIDPRCGAVLQKAIADVRPDVALEVGLAYGISTLYMLEALAATGGGKLIGMDPAQFDAYWRGGGLNNVERAGYRALYEFHEATSQRVLPQLMVRGERIGVAFIDGWHTFDHTLVDFFYVDQLLDVGGVVVFDDVGYPAIRRVCEFVLANRSYEICDLVEHGKAPTPRQRFKGLLREWLRPVYRTDQTPAAETRSRLAPLRDAYFVALRKLGDDERRFDHFVHF
jgi:predicted O-methyltransferase YrrM